MIPAKYWSPTKKLMVLGAMAGGKLVEDTATGNPLTFITDKAKPLKSLLIPFTPVQSGTGDPSPQNIRSILPWNGLKVFGGGKNLYDAEKYPLVENRLIYGSDGTLDGTTNAYSATVKYIPIDGLGGKKITLNKRPGGYGTGIGFYTAESQSSFISGLINNSGTAGTPWTFTVPENAKFMRFTTVGNASDIQLEAGETATAYEPFKPITETDISFPSPVYGGTLDVVSGVLTVEFIPVDLSTMGFTYRSGWNCWVASADERFETVESNNTPTRALTAEAKAVIASGYTSSHPANTFSQNTNGVWFFDNGSDTDAPEGYLIVPLATPQEIQLTPQQITALVGDNTIWSDADGSMTAVYLKKG